MRRLLCLQLILLALIAVAPASAAQTPVLSASGQTLTWTGGNSVQFIVESTPANPTALVTLAAGTHSYTPPAKPGVTVTYRVRPKPSPNRWSNAVSIAYPAEPPKEEPPANLSPPTISGTAQQGHTLTETNGSWTNAPTSYAHLWLRCDAAGANCLSTGATASTYPLTAPDVGHTIRVRETASNGAGPGTAATSTQTAVVAAPTEEPPPPKGTAGEVKYRLNAKSAYDQYAGNTTFLKEHIDRILGYGAFAWSHYVPTGIPVVCYLDAYTHWGAHTLNPTHRAEYVAEAKREVEHGCAGIFNDDIEWEGSGQHEVGTDAEVLALIEAVRQAIGPGKINQINTQWVDLWPRIKSGDPEVLKSLNFIDHNDKEFGVNGSSGINSVSAFTDYLAYVDYLHAHTPNSIHIDQADSTPGDVYEVATYLLNNDGGDYIGSFVTPETWNSLYDTNLGAATGLREHIGTAYRRKFVGGTVYVNPPGAATTTVDGHTLAGRSGLIVPA